jgi:hypothetical protein
VSQRQPSGAYEVKPGSVGRFGTGTSLSGPLPPLLFCEYKTAKTMTATTKPSTSSARTAMPQSAEVHASGVLMVVTVVLFVSTSVLIVEEKGLFFFFSRRSICLAQHFQKKIFYMAKSGYVGPLLADRTMFLDF